MVQKFLNNKSLSLVLGLGVAAAAQADRVIVTISNDAPENGVFLVNPWIAFHDGSFDTFTVGSEASAGVESASEDGDTSVLDSNFLATYPDNLSATLPGPSQPSNTQSYVFEVDPTDPSSRYMSYFAMLIPSNDAFIGNDSPNAYEIFDASGNFVANSPITVLGSSVYDAGTEVNDETPANVAFLAQAAPNTGTTESGVVALHPGFNAMGTGGILDATREFGGETINFTGANFTESGYTMATITVIYVPIKTEQIVVTITNDAPEDGVFLVSPWVGFHDGSFDSFTMGEMASAGLEASAEDGNTGPLDAEFLSAIPEGISATLGGPTAPSMSQTYVFELDPLDPNSRYFSYISMLIPSNDAFIGNGDPMAYEIFDELGNFVATPINIYGTSVYDAGTEVNDEVPSNVAFLAQAAPNTGTTENGLVGPHPGFNDVGTGGILDATREFGGSTINFSSANFSEPDYKMARITISKLNNPDTSSDLINISTRSYASDGENTQIAGFVVAGEEEKTVLIRAIGPGLAPFDVTGYLPDPMLMVYDTESNIVAANDDVGDQDDVATVMAAIEISGAFEIDENSLDAALVVTLAPGEYTAHVVTEAGVSGVTLIEVYEIP